MVINIETRWNYTDKLCHLEHSNLHALSYKTGQSYVL